MLNFFIQAYVGLVSLASIWGLAAFYMWGRYGHNHEPAVLKHYPPRMMTTFENRYYLRKPRPVDVFKAIAITFTPVLNLAFFGPGLLIVAFELVYSTFNASVRFVSRCMLRDPQRLHDWFFGRRAR